MDIRHRGWQFDLDLFGNEQNLVAVPCEHRNENSGCNKKMVNTESIEEAYIF